MNHFVTLPFVDQSAADIRYVLTDGAVDMSQFTIIEQQTFTWNKNLVDVGILAESHFVTVRSDTETLTEICACTNVDTRGVCAIHQNKLSDHRGPLLEITDSVLYTFHTEYIPWHKGLNKIELLKRIAVQSDQTRRNSISMLHTFSNDDLHKGEGAAFTLISAEVGDSLLIRTVHSYPNESVFVLTHSSWSRHKTT